jgi:hypothetical protein
MVCWCVTNFCKVGRAIRYIFCDEKSPKDAAAIPSANIIIEKKLALKKKITYIEYPFLKKIEL